MINIAVYGTLRRGNGNHLCLGNSRQLGTTILQGFGMVSLGGFPAIDREEGSSVVIEVYECNEEAEERCNRLEGYDPNATEHTFYDRISIDTEFGPAVVYVMPGILEERAHARIATGDWHDVGPAGISYAAGS